MSRKMEKQDISLFIGSTVEDLEIAEALQSLLDYSCEVTVWNQMIIEPSNVFLKSFVEQTVNFDFAVLILSSVDKIESRGSEELGPRDNVIYELGLFTGAIGRGRTFMLYDRSKPPKLPTDLLGITPIDYEPHSSGELEPALGAASRKIKKSLKKLGPRIGRKHLSTIQENLSRLEVLSKPFPRWLCKMILKSSSRSILTFKHLVDGIEKGKVAYNKGVKDIFVRDDIDTILALCGGKFQTQAENDPYFARFYDFARNRKVAAQKSEDYIHVCRIFVQPEKGEFSGLISKVIEDHREERENGVLALTVMKEKRKNLEEHFDRGFCTALDEGIGFLLFFTSRSVIVVVHEGISNDFAFFRGDKREHRDLIFVVFQMFELLCEESEEYHKTDSTERENVDSLLKRLQPTICLQ